MQQQSTVLEILLFLFDAIVYGNEKVDTITIEKMQKELSLAGFKDEEIEKAINWLIELNDKVKNKNEKIVQTDSFRLYSESERKKITIEAQGFLIKLEQLGIIDFEIREIILQKIMLLDEDNIDLDDMKWVVLMAIYNLPNKEASIIWLENSISRLSDFVAIN